MRSFLSAASCSRLVKGAAAVCFSASVFMLGYAVAAQPHMVNALNDLRAAKGELEVAAANKGGHRIAAIARVNEALNEVNLGIQAGE